MFLIWHVSSFLKPVEEVMEGARNSYVAKDGNRTEEDKEKAVKPAEESDGIQGKDRASSDNAKSFDFDEDDSDSGANNEKQKDSGAT
jgi:hypothetical protein